MIKFKYGEYDLTVSKIRYKNGIEALIVEQGEPLAIVGKPIHSGETLAKGFIIEDGKYLPDGIIEALIEYKILLPVAQVKDNFVLYQINVDEKVNMYPLTVEEVLDV